MKEKNKIDIESLVKDYMEYDHTLSRKDAIKKVKKFTDKHGIIPLTKMEKHGIEQKAQDERFRKSEEKTEEIIKDYMEDDPTLPRGDAIKKINNFAKKMGRFPLTKAEINQEKFNRKAKELFGILFWFIPLIVIFLSVSDIIHLNAMEWAFAGLIYISIFAASFYYGK